MDNENQVLKEVRIEKYIEGNNRKEEILTLIFDFWKEHNSLITPPEILESDYKLWTGEGSVLYLIKYQDETAGFGRLGSRGCDSDWLEDIFVKNEFKNLGIGSKAILLLEEEVRKYSVSMYIEVSARN